ncbi:uncharacterized protein K452DRAFT_170044 [Aplosporella prunicola CBS 121167]|uniref:Uncharacterized protein n=1 Tax=Aplosporella prunicola CBS 121167 TaxID=1176127 RepID=A0A6A6BGV1_9PEZI|nr:uncharacterized protein K452DRAFT_170044 [Aplosporella prunicola CBS 121167]KAF2143380.1 hypothetical protein K452DRAFT_170044 [Aplosporella prunicola CBS 121167]
MLPSAFEREACEAVVAEAEGLMKREPSGAWGNEVSHLEMLNTLLRRPPELPNDGKPGLAMVIIGVTAPGAQPWFSDLTGPPLPSEPLSFLLSSRLHLLIQLGGTRSLPVHASSCARPAHATDAVAPADPSFPRDQSALTSDNIAGPTVGQTSLLAGCTSPAFQFLCLCHTCVRACPPSNIHAGAGTLHDTSSCTCGWPKVNPYPVSSCLLEPRATSTYSALGLRRPL